MSRAVILDHKGREQQSRVPLWLPPGLQELPVVATCRICKAQFREGQERTYQQHVGRCFHEHRDELMASAPSERKKGTVWDSETVGDPEIEEHYLRVGERMRAENRWEMRPNEVAGSDGTQPGAR
jgi:hypothetical protein